MKDVGDLASERKDGCINLRIFKEIYTFESGHFQKLPQRVAAFQICIPIHTMTWKLEDITILQSISYNYNQLHHLIQFLHTSLDSTIFGRPRRYLQTFLVFFRFS